MNRVYDDGKGLCKVFGSKAYGEYFWSKRIGCIGVDEPSGAFAYSGNTVKDDSNYFIPAELTEEQIIEAMEKSVKDGHDYLYDLVAKPENEVVYVPGRIY